MKYLVAVSGGVDSVVLLDMLSKSDHQLIVAHVDHGIRNDSAADARFVAALAKRYQLPFVTTRFELGAGASEERAREARYGFLTEQAAKYGATIATAHHAGDAVETVAINISRGTGWRGLAVLGREEIHRPLLSFTKSQLRDYANRERLEWVEDSTNQSDAYHRNRLRRKLTSLLAVSAAEQVMALRARQLQLRRDIARESAHVLAAHMGSRHFLTQIDDVTAVELLGYMVEKAGATRPTRPQLVRALHAVKTAKPGTSCQVGSGIELHFTARKFTVVVV